MPELPEVETVCRGLNQQTRGQIIRGGEVLLERSIAHPDSVAEFWAGIGDRELVEWRRRGKYLLADLHPAGGLVIHLRMSGQLLWVDRACPLPKHTRVRWFFSDSQELRFVDTRTFGKVWWIPGDRTFEDIATGLQNLGPDPFSEEFSTEFLQAKLHRRRRSIKATLLDQAIVAGMGNIYADEALFTSGIRPDREAGSLTTAEIERLHAAAIAVLKAGIEQGGTTFDSFRNLLGVNGNYMGIAWVYGRTGEPCRTCGTSIQRQKLQGRSSHFCPQCQQ